MQANPPAKNFWSLTIYDTYNRVQLDNPTQVADISSRKDGLKGNEEGSVDLYLGPQSARRMADQLDRDRARQGMVRLYGPTEGYFYRATRKRWS